MEKKTLSERIKEYSKKFSKRVFNTYEPTHQEQLICETVLKSLEDPSTNRIIWENDFILIAGGDCTIKLDGLTLFIISTAGNVRMHCSTSFVDLLRKRASEVFSRDIAEIERSITEREEKMLEAIASSLPEFTDVQ